MVVSFQIEVGGRGPGDAYRVQAQASGRSAEAALELPALSGDAAAQGAALARAVFVPAVRQLLLDVARGADEAGARMQIQLRLGAPELIGLPWEWMSLGSQNLWQPAIRDDYALVRVGQAVRPPPALTTPAPLRLLIAAAAGHEDAADALGAALLGEVRARRLVVDRLRDAEPAALADALAEEPCHLLHLIGPVAAGGAPARAGAPRLRMGRGLDPHSLAGIIEESAGLRMVTLAATDRGPADQLAALAAALHEQIGLATLALADPEGAAGCAATCYAAIVAGEPADLAATAGRASLAEAGGAWGSPLLYMAPGGEELFRIGAEPVAAPDRPRRAEQRPRAGARAPTPRRARGDDDYPTQPFQPIARPQPRPAAVGRPEAGPAGFRLSPRVIALIIATVILIIMVSQNLRRPEESAPATPTVTVAPAATAPPTR